MAPINTSVFETKLSLRNPTLTAKGEPSVRFDVDFQRLDGSSFMTIPGWRVKRGNVWPPARRQGTGWYPSVEIDSKVQGLLAAMVRDWQAEFPTVTFPGENPSTEPVPEEAE